jgi:hypothetical protein
MAINMIVPLVVLVELDAGIAIARKSQNIRMQALSA